MSGGFPGAVVFVLLILAIGYAFYLQLPGIASQNGSSASSNGLLQRIFPGLYNSSTQRTAQEIPMDLPSGWNAGNLSPFFREARITGFADASGSGKVLLVRIPQGAAIAGWSLRGTLGSQLIGSEGAMGTTDVRITLRTGVLMPEHDRALLLDASGMLADYYQY
jgi:hypothetical protein